MVMSIALGKELLQILHKLVTLAFALCISYVR